MFTKDEYAEIKSKFAINLFGGISKAINEDVKKVIVSIQNPLYKVEESIPPIVIEWIEKYDNYIVAQGESGRYYLLKPANLSKIEAPTEFVVFGNYMAVC